MSWEPWTAWGVRGGYCTVRRLGPIALVLECTLEGDYRSWVQGSPSRPYATSEAALRAGHRNLRRRLRALIRQAQPALNEPLGDPSPWTQETP